MCILTRYHFNKYGWPSSKMGGVPSSDEDKNELVDMLQDKKTFFYKQIVDEVGAS